MLGSAHPSVRAPAIRLHSAPNRAHATSRAPAEEPPQRTRAFHQEHGPLLQRAREQAASPDAFARARPSQLPRDVGRRRHAIVDACCPLDIRAGLTSTCGSAALRPFSWRFVHSRSDRARAVRQRQRQRRIRVGTALTVGCLQRRKRRARRGGWPARGAARSSGHTRRWQSAACARATLCVVAQSVMCDGSGEDERMDAERE